MGEREGERERGECMYLGRRRIQRYTVKKNDEFRKSSKSKYGIFVLTG